MLSLGLRWVLLAGMVISAAGSNADSKAEASANTDLSQVWPQWRGPQANGVAPHADPPLRWSETNHVRWKIPLPGKGHSSPIIVGDQLYLTAAIPVGEAKPPVYDRAPGTHDNVPVTHQHRFVVLSVDRRDGKIAWQKVVREEFPHEGGHATGSLASNSAVSDGERIFAFFGSRGLYCLDRSGQMIWKKDLGRMDTLHAHGEGSSPVVHGDSLIVCWDHEGQSALYRFDRRTGREIWKVMRDEKTSWSTPLVVEHDGRVQIVISATKRVRGYDFNSGELVWECSGLSRNVVSSPVAGGGMVFAGNSYDWQAMLAIRLSKARGDITDTDRVAWKLNRLTPYVSSPLLYGDTLYFLRHNQNILSRLDPITGQPRGEPLRLEGLRDFIFASPVGAANRIYVTGRDGATVVLDHSRENAIVAVNQLDDSFSASAALAGRDLYLRGEKNLYCLSSAEKGPVPKKPGDPQSAKR
jgi:outer membrane protein assembly factor BamB